MDLCAHSGSSAALESLERTSSCTDVALQTTLRPRFRKSPRSGLRVSARSKAVDGGGQATSVAESDCDGRGLCGSGRRQRGDDVVGVGSCRTGFTAPPSVERMEARHAKKAQSRGLKPTGLPEREDAPRAADRLDRGCTGGL